MISVARQDVPHNLEDSLMNHKPELEKKIPESLRFADIIGQDLVTGY